MSIGAPEYDALIAIVVVGFVGFVLFLLWSIRVGAWIVAVAGILGALAGIVVGSSLGESIAPCDFTVAECIGPSDGAILGGSVGLLIGAIVGAISGWAIQRRRGRHGTPPPGAPKERSART